MKTPSQMIHPATGTDYSIPLYISPSGRKFYPIGGGSEPAGVETPAPPSEPQPAAPAAPAAPAPSTPQFTPPPVAPAAPAPAAPADEPAAAEEPETKVFDEAYVKKLRDEAAKHRTEGQQFKTVLDTIAKALNPEAGEPEKLDAAKLTTELAAERTSHTDLQREHRVLLSALDVGADYKALLDSRSFLVEVAKLNPAGDGFADEVKAAVEKAVADNPKLKTGQAPTTSTAPHTSRPGEGDGPPTNLEDAIAQKMRV